MNIFILSWCVKQCALWHFDKHVVKMIVELAQLLSTAHWQLDTSVDSSSTANLHSWLADGVIYKSTHVNHPCAKWVREHPNNYRYTVRLAKALCEEYYFRYGEQRNRRHATERIIDHLQANVPQNWPLCNKSLIGEHGVTEPAQAMPDDFKVPNDVVAAYRLYYQSDAKQPLASWKDRPQPNWYTRRHTGRQIQSMIEPGSLIRQKRKKNQQTNAESVQQQRSNRKLSKKRRTVAIPADMNGGNCFSDLREEILRLPIMPLQNLLCDRQLK